MDEDDRTFRHQPRPAVTKGRGLPGLAPSSMASSLFGQIAEAANYLRTAIGWWTTATESGWDVMWEAEVQIRCRSAVLAAYRAGLTAVAAALVIPAEGSVAELAEKVRKTGMLDPLAEDTIGTIEDDSSSPSGFDWDSVLDLEEMLVELELFLEGVADFLEVWGA